VESAAKALEFDGRLPDRANGILREDWILGEQIGPLDNGLRGEQAVEGILMYVRQTLDGHHVIERDSDYLDAVALLSFDDVDERLV
jgi:hypothetical protein